MKKTAMFVLSLVCLAGCGLDNKLTSDMSIGKGDWYSSAIGVLPAIGLSATHISIDQADAFFQKGIRSRYQENKNRPRIDGSKKVKAGLMDKDLLDDFIKVQNALASINTLDFARMTKIGKVLGYRFLILPVLVNDTTFTETSDGNSVTHFIARTRIMIFDVDRGSTVGVIKSNHESLRSLILLHGSLASAYRNALKKAATQLY